MGPAIGAGSPQKIYCYARKRRFLDHWQPENRRPVLMPTLIENSAIPESLLMELADTASRETVKMLLASARARSTPGVVEALLGNANLEPAEAQALQGVHSEPAAVPQQTEPTLEEFEVVPDPESAAALEAFQREHAAAIAAEEGKPFELVDEDPPVEAALQEPAASVVEEAESEEPAAVAPEAFRGKAFLPKETWTSLRLPSRRNLR